MQPTSESFLKQQLVERQSLLRQIDQSGDQRAEIAVLIQDVDSALQRLADGTLGVCTVCQGQIDRERLFRDPSAQVCFECMTPTQLQTLEEDLRTAVHIQAALLPKPSIQVGGWDLGHSYQPLGPVSGDYCDIISSGEFGDSAYFLLGDVSGKGVSASMTMTQLHGTFRSLIPLQLPLPDLLGRVNRLLSETTLSSVFATLVVGRLEPSGTIELCNAGHHPPLLVHGKQLTKVEATGLPLGLFPDQEFEIRTLQLEPDDLLFLYTDGLPEATNPAGFEFGLQEITTALFGLRGALATSVADRCSQLASLFRGVAPGNDDLTILVVRRERP
jgi:sigma-B regulation protein RsbU (phosphoserine phosphatase)